ncbi:MAG: trehalose-6-phosphate synthase [Kiloniellales bacterium]|nr:trehalose-6-phosphate synthase [Kiloniellales bacterium]
MSRLVAVSNRVADLHDPGQSGGLAVGLCDALKARGGIWFGWDGKTVGQGTRVPPRIQKVERATTITLPLTHKDYREYYAGFSNSVLWPVLHNRLDLVEFEPAFLRGYKRVNSKFADALLPHLKAKDTIWIHDYHLIPLAAELRRRGCRQKMGFFLHTPFPPPEILAAAPENDRLIHSLFAYDLLGFQTETDLDNFRRYAEEFGAGRIDDSQSVTAFGKNVSARFFPIGIDVDSFAAMAHTRDADEKVQALRHRTLARKHIIGVDRLDYSKGLPDRLEAFRRLLEMYPENQKSVTFMQIAPPTREDVEAYSDIRIELETLSGAINGQFADFDWTPLRYIHRAIPRRTLAALFRGSQVGFVSPLRDGMNLVAKEYVAAQDDKDPGVLVLSKFAGAAEDMKEALIVNPYNIDEMAENLQQALNMPLAERRHRQRALMKRIRARDAHAWQSSFLDALEGLPGNDAT